MRTKKGGRAAEDTSPADEMLTSASQPDAKSSSATRTANGAPTVPPMTPNSAPHVLPSEELGMEARPGRVHPGPPGAHQALHELAVHVEQAAGGTRPSARPFCRRAPSRRLAGSKTGGSVVSWSMMGVRFTTPLVTTRSPPSPAIPCAAKRRRSEDDDLVGRDREPGSPSSSSVLAHNSTTLLSRQVARDPSALSRVFAAMLRLRRAHRQERSAVQRGHPPEQGIQRRERDRNYPERWVEHRSPRPSEDEPGPQGEVPQPGTGPEGRVAPGGGSEQPSEPPPRGPGAPPAELPHHEAAPGSEYADDSSDMAWRRERTKQSAVTAIATSKLSSSKGRASALPPTSAIRMSESKAGAMAAARSTLGEVSTPVTRAPRLARASA